MRIAMFSENFYPELSGIADSILDTGRELARRGHQVDYYVPRYSKKDFAAINIEPHELEAGNAVGIHRLFSLPYPAPTKQGEAVVPTFLRWRGMRENKPDIIHTHLFFGTGLEALSAAKHLKVPLVGTSHTPITEFTQYGPLKSRLVDNAALRFVSWFYNHCEFVSAPSWGILKEMQAHKFKKPCRALSNPIDIGKFFPPENSDEKNKIKKEFGLSDFAVLYTGRLAKEKGIDVIIRAVAAARSAIPEISLAIAGHGSYEDDLKRLADELGLGEKVKFLGTLQEERHAKVYRAVEVFAIASTAETQSLSLMKALASRVPAIGVNARALPEYITPECGFIVEPGDFAAMAGKIIWFHANPAGREKLGEGGLAEARKFSKENIADEWEKIYQEVIKNYKK